MESGFVFFPGGGGKEEEEEGEEEEGDSHPLMERRGLEIIF